MTKSPTRWRFITVVTVLGILALGLVVRLIDLSIFHRHFLLAQGDARSLRTMVIPAHRGMITDSEGDPLAISTSVSSVWVNPTAVLLTPEKLEKLSELLNISKKKILSRIKHYKKREFLYLKRHINPQLALKIRMLHIPGLHFQTEYKRYYPEAEVDAHLVGFTNIDDFGQEGLELVFNNWLAGDPGKRKVIKDRLGHIIADIDDVKKPEQGHDLQLAINQQVQYQSYHELLNAVTKFHAKSGSVVVLDTQNHTVVSMVNVPSYNPNLRPSSHDGRYRNRAATDVFEPGSTMKPFTLAYALESGKFTPDSIINTRPGWMVLDGYTIEDTRDHGIITLTQLLQESSNIGAAKVMLQLDGTNYRQMLSNIGFGSRTGSGFPGEVSGRLPYHGKWRKIDLATLAFGYGLTVTPLQLAKAYAVIANNGMSYPISFLAQNPEMSGTRVIPAKICTQIRKMMETVVERGGTGTKAAIQGYKIAGKTGTAHIAANKGYAVNRYVASFIGFAPALRPRFVVAVVISEPKPDYYGGTVAAPVFKQVMSSALREFNVAPVSG
jgi:cell division protein FtsI (penicillin-binding protein 3)